MRLYREVACCGLLSVGAGCGSVGLEDATSNGSAGDVTLEPEGEINFGSQSPYGRPATVTMRLTSVGLDPVTVEDAWVEANAVDTMYTGSLPFPLEMAPGDVVPFDLKFKPDGRGNFHGRLVVTVRGGPELERNLVGYGCEDDNHDGAC